MRTRRFSARFGPTLGQRLLSAALYSNVLLAVILATTLLFAELPSDVGLPLKILAICLMFYLVGEATLFPMLSRLPVLWRLFPNIDGDYLVEVRSNWSAPRRRLSASDSTYFDCDASPYSKIGRARIETSLLGLRMRLVARRGRKCSEAVVCVLRRDRTSNLPVLFYIFDSADPKCGYQRHLGAARLSIPAERYPEILEGTYWTARDWQEGLNTAGDIRLRRVTATAGESHSSPAAVDTERVVLNPIYPSHECSDTADAAANCLPRSVLIRAGVARDDNSVVSRSAAERFT